MVIAQYVMFVVISVLTLAVQMNAVSVNPSLCPTNKIAPHRREASWASNRPRTLGLIHSILAPSPNRPRPPPLNDIGELQEQPQEDDPDDCGEIEDYDETDLSSITPSATNKVFDSDKRNHRYLLGDNYIKPSHYLRGPSQPPHPTSRPQRLSTSHNLPQRPSDSRGPQRPAHQATRPPFYSGEIFGSYFYGPSTFQYPSNNIKPVQEDTYDYPQIAYHPGLIGGTLAHVVGFPPVSPTLSNDVVSSVKKHGSSIRFPDNDSNKMRRPRAKPPNLVTSVIGSFVDLLFN